MRRVIYLSTLVAIVAVVGAFLWGFNFSGASNLPPVHIDVIAKDMSFNQNNPPIVVERGQTVHITIKNEEQPGVYHDFAISALKVKTQLLEPGEAETVRFTADRKGMFTYTCPFHPQMMTGKIIVK